MNWGEFFSMGGRGFFVWGSFGALVLGLLIEVVVLRARSARIHAELRQKNALRAAASVRS